MNGFNFFESYFLAAEKLSSKERLAFYDKLMRFMFKDDDTEINGVAGAVWEGVKPVAKKSKAKSCAGKVSGEARREQTVNKQRTNIEQTDNEQRTSIEQTDNEQRTNSEQNANHEHNANHKEKDKEKDKDKGDGKEKGYNNPPLSPLGGKSKHDYEKHTNVENVVYLLNNDEYKHKQYIRDHPDLWKAIKEWMEYKQNAKGKEKRHYQESSIPKLLTEIVEKCLEIGEENVIKAIDISIGRGYMGITWDLVKKSKSIDINNVMEGIT